jgi:hypothetical protein
LAGKVPEESEQAGRRFRMFRRRRRRQESLEARQHVPLLQSATGLRQSASPKAVQCVLRNSPGARNCGIATGLLTFSLRRTRAIVRIQNLPEEGRKRRRA